MPCTLAQPELHGTFKDQTRRSWPRSQPSEQQRPPDRGCPADGLCASLIPRAASRSPISRRHALSASQNAARHDVSRSEPGQAIVSSFDIACMELGLREADEASRARVSSAITTLARAGQLKTYAVTVFSG